MARSELISLTGEVMTCLDERLYKVLLPNGHELLGHLGEKVKRDSTRCLPGVRVSLQLTPRDLSRARILKVLE
jgi:translation initiation factor IF-1